MSQQAKELTLEQAVVALLNSQQEIGNQLQQLNRQLSQQLTANSQIELAKAGMLALQKKRREESLLDKPITVKHLAIGAGIALAGYAAYKVFLDTPEAESLEK